MPNQRELAQLTQTVMDGNGWLEDSALRLVENLGLEALVVTRGGDGMSLFEKTEQGVRRVDIPTMAKSVYDVTGAGDTAIAAFAAAVASGSSLETAVRLANLAAGIKVGKRGTACVSSLELMDSAREEWAGHSKLENEASLSSETRTQDHRAQRARPAVTQHLTKV